MPPRPWSPEMASVGAGVTAMAEAIASRELRCGLMSNSAIICFAKSIIG